MAEHVENLELELEAERSSVTKARHAVTALARAAGAHTGNVGLAVSEAVGNSVVHGFRDGATGTIVVRARIDGTHLVVEVIDHGVGMKPHIEEAGLGIGMSLISRLSRDAAFASTDTGTTVTMRFDLEGAG